MKRLFVALSLSLAASAALAQAQVERFYGYAYDLDSGRYLYTEVHEQSIEGNRWLGGSIRYYDPQGASLGVKTLDFSRDEFIPLYRLSLPYREYAEGIRSIGDKVEIYTEQGGKIRSKQVSRRAPIAADSGFHSYIRTHFKALMAGEVVPFSLIVAGNLDDYRFRIKKVGDTRFDGKDAVRLIVEPDSILRLIVDPLDLVYDPKLMQLLEYRGISNISDPVTGKPYNARIIYPAQPPADAPKPLPPLN